MRVLIFFLVAVFCLHKSAYAQEGVQQVSFAVEERQDQLAEISRQLALGEGDLIALQEQVRELRRQAEAASIPLQAKVEQIRADLDRLGPTPEAGVSEATAIAEERSRLNAEFRQYDSISRQTSLNIAEAQRMIEEIAVLRRDQFFRDLFARGPTPLLPTIWTDGVQTLSDGMGQMTASVTTFVEGKETSGELNRLILSLVAAFGLAIALWIPIRRAIGRLIVNRIQGVEPLASRKVLVAASWMIVRVIPGVLGGYLILEAMKLNGAIPEAGLPLARAIWITFVGFMLVEGAADGVFSPRYAEWRIVPLSSAGARRVRIFFLAAVAVLGADFILQEEAALFGQSTELIIAQKTIITLLLAVIAWLLTRRKLWVVSEASASEADPESVPKVMAGSRLRTGARVLAIFSVGAVLLGYVTLGHFLMSRLFLLLVIAGAIWTLRALLREAVRLLDRRFSSHRAGGEDTEGRLFYYWVSGTIDIITALAFIPPALLVLGAEWADVRGVIVDAFVGFNIGNVRISLAKIFMALLLVVGLIYTTRVVQRVAETRIFKGTRIDSGVQNSFKTLIGYVGLIIAFVVGVGTLGFNLSNLAIIAGALSVGIGFGLQSIVNNFVSGLILLFERPIKVGDWVVTTSGEGIVKRISVRSTEIETFDRASVIVPNAELISNAVTNWTHKNTIGRLTIPVGISYDLDPAVAIKLLEEVAKEDEDMLNYPPAYVFFEDFGDNSQNLQLRGFIRDINSSLSIRTRLRCAIWKKFQEHGVEIPFPQRDLHLRSSDLSSTANR